MRSQLERFRQDQAGAVIVETALILPLMITLSAGVFEFSNAIYTRLLLEAGVTDAARYMARCVHDDTVLSDVSDCKTAARNLAVCGTVGAGSDLNDCGTATDGQLRVAGLNTGDIDIVTELTSPYLPHEDAVDSTGAQIYQSTTDHVSIAKVSVTYSYSGTGLLGVLGFGPLTLRVSHQERVIGW